MGRIPSRFFSSTIDLTAASYASSRCAAQPTTLIGIAAYGTRSGGSNSPSLNRVASVRASARSISASVISPRSAASARCSYVQMQLMSQPALTARAALSAASAVR
jgi:hypothetical protein